MESHETKEGRPRSAEHSSREMVLQGLLLRVSLGDDGAMSELYDETCASVFGLANRILRNTELAEEATVDAYVSVFRKAPQFDFRRGAALTWILTIARSRALDSLRRNRKRDYSEIPIEKGEQIGSDVAPSALAAPDRTEDARHVQQALQRLPQHQRELIEAAFLTGYSHAELAEIYGLPLGTVKGRIRAGLAALRRFLPSEGEAE